MSEGTAVRMFSLTISQSGMYGGSTILSWGSSDNNR